MSSSILERVRAIGLMPVVSKVAVDDSEKLAKALVEGGIPAAEITFRMEGADEVISRIRKAYPDMIVGAGTVTSVEIAEKAIQAGAQFIVSPGLNPDVVRYVQSQGVDMIPGVITPSEVEQAIGFGLRTLKFFPAEQSGGLASIKAICAPYRDIEFMPTGGINLGNLTEYLSFDRIAACGGTYMLGKYAETGEWEQITALCRKSVQTMLGLKLAHVGINSEDEVQAGETVSAIANLLLLDAAKPGASSIFVDSAVEVMKSQYLGKNGHIGISTVSITRAVNYFRSVGISFREETAKRDDKGTLKAIYFSEEVAGFAFHLVQCASN